MKRTLRIGKQVQYEDFGVNKKIHLALQKIDIKLQYSPSLLLLEIAWVFMILKKDPKYLKPCMRYFCIKA